MEPDEGLERLRDALKICHCYRDTFHDRRTHLSEYFKEGPVVAWDFQPSLVFARMDRLTYQMGLLQVSGYCLIPRRGSYGEGGEQEYTSPPPP